MSPTQRSIIYQHSSSVSSLWRQVLTCAACLLALCLSQSVSAQTGKTTTREGRTQPRPPLAPATTLVRKHETLPPAKAGALPPPVIAVAHSLSGWKLRALLTSPNAPVAAAFDDKFIRTNIVAGYLLPDGRSVIARLPQAEAEMLNFSAESRRLGLSRESESPGLMLVRRDGSQLKAEFVGLDGSTGLSLLEAAEPIAPASVDMPGVSPVVGQRVRLIAPVSAEPLLSAAAPVKEDGPIGEAGMLYMDMSETAGQLREVERRPSGRTTAFTVQAERATPELIGGVALTESGALVGIIEQGEQREMRVLPAEVIRGAVARVQARRASVPQPWLGARGEAVAGKPLDIFLARGWSRAAAREVLNRQRGVLLTAVAPGTPAALAGLRPGDIIKRVGKQEIRTVEDMTWILKEVGGNALTNFTVLRAQSIPLVLSVRLSESLNPIQETARAEVRAAAAELRRLEEAANRLQDGETLARLTAARARMVEATARLRQSPAARLNLPLRTLLPFGLQAIPVAGTEASRPESDRELLVLFVRPNSAAALAGIREGDCIETINQQSPALADVNFGLTTDAAEISLGLRRDKQQFTVKLVRSPVNK